MPELENEVAEYVAQVVANYLVLELVDELEHHEEYGFPIEMAGVITERIYEILEENKEELLEKYK